jgi:hypothetical protein
MTRPSGDDPKVDGADDVGHLVDLRLILDWQAGEMPAPKAKVAAIEAGITAATADMVGAVAGAWQVATPLSTTARSAVPRAPCGSLSELLSH